MLRIHFGDMDTDNYIFNSYSFFNNTYEGYIGACHF